MFSNLKNKVNALTYNHGLFFLLCIAIILVVFVLIVALLGGGRKNGTTSTPTPTNVPGGTSTQHKIAPSQKTIIEKTTKKEVEELPKVEGKSTLPNGATRYTFSSPIITRKNEVIVKDNHVVFERVLTPVSSKDPGYVLISDYEKEYGKPQQIIRGSHFYGNLIKTYIYADKGFVLIGNPFTDEVFEVHTFIPTTIENYIQLYGEDINKNAPAGES
jgi:hypothetical protein